MYGTTTLPVALRHQTNLANPANTMHLEEVRDALRAQTAKLEPEDCYRPLALHHLRLAPRGGTHQLYPMTGGQLGEPMVLTKNALSQLASRVLPRYGLGFIDRLVGTTEAADTARDADRGRQLAELSMAAFMAQEHTDPSLLRTVRVDGQLTCRAVLSQTYGVVDDLQVVEAMLAAGEGWSQLPVLQADVNGTDMRIRLALDPHLEPEAMLNRPVPVIDVGNSCVGRRSVWASAASYTLRCTNGMHDWSPEGTWRWRHTGDPSRIVKGLSDCLDVVRTRASGLVEAYDQALGVQVDDLYALLEGRLSSMGLTQGFVQAAQRSLGDHERAPQVPGHTLGHAVAAVTLAAHISTDDLLEQDRLERAGGQLLRWGLSNQEQGRLTVGEA